MNVVLVEPEIPPNTGNVARLCAATGAILHLVGPLGFRLDDRELKRAGMDYWQQVTWKYWEDLQQLRTAVESGLPLTHTLSPKGRGDRGGQGAESRRVGARAWSPRPAGGEAGPAIAGSGEGALGAPRFWYVTTKSDRSYTQVRYRWGDYLVFGRETAGLPRPLLAAHPENTITIPMFQPAARSLNLATAVAIVLYESLRQVKGF
ncbi:tRNA (cytidine(34)-2'-O)-methyltransferase [bacterium]|nr:tRNA (cytidine(34)-2'-O)-methyltransferase [bacterium]